MAKNKKMNTDSTSKKRTTSTQKVGKKGGMSGVVAPAVGAVAGAVIGGVTAAALSDEKKRKAIGETVTSMADYAVDAMDSVNENMSEAQDAVRTTAEKTIEVTDKTGNK
jgi:hypothetical protein